MTEFGISQGHTWCDLCKIYVPKNPTSIRTHELGTRHKDTVAKKIADVRKDNAEKEEKLLALKDLEKIETRPRESYERDLAAMPILNSTSKLLVSDANSKGSVIRVQEFSKAVPAARRGSGCEPVDKIIVANPQSQVLQGQHSGTQNACSADHYGRSLKRMGSSSLKDSKRMRVENSGSNFGEDDPAA